MGCFTDYYNAVSKRPYLTVMADLDSAVTLIGCVRAGTGFREIGPGYDAPESANSLTEAEKAQATALAERVRHHAGSGPHPRRADEHSQLADDAYAFAIASFVHKAPRQNGGPANAME